jgi:SAM-dependent methyltransferase
MTGASPGDAWTRYWTAAGAKPGGGCLPNAAGPVEATQRIVWQDFARDLARGARLLDLATGNGIVLGWIAAARRDLKLVGVDSAAVLPPPPKGATLKAGVALERLPFGAASFDAATSQFGIEYGDVPAAARELARVLRPGAPVRMIVHHAASAIVEHNRARREALGWALAPGGLLDKGRAFAAAGMTIPVPPAFHQAPVEAQRLFPGQSVAAEFAIGVVQRLELVRSRGGAEALAALAAMEREAAGESARIALMERAARDEAGAAAMSEALAHAGFAMEPLAVLPQPQAARPLAWILSGTR